MTDLFSLASVFLFQIGSRFLQIDFTEHQKKVIMHPVTQNMIVFSMFYVATHSFPIAFFLWALYFAFKRILFNENHKFNLLPRSWVQKDIGRQSITDLYYENLQKLPL